MISSRGIDRARSLGNVFLVIQGLPSINGSLGYCRPPKPSPRFSRQLLPVSTWVRFVGCNLDEGGTHEPMSASFGRGNATSRRDVLESASCGAGLPDRRNEHAAKLSHSYGDTARGLHGLIQRALHKKTPARNWLHSFLSFGSEAIFSQCFLSSSPR